MAKIECSTCFDPKPTLKCKLCSSALCKKCAQVVADDRMTYLDKNVPAPVKGGGVFCNSCFDGKVAPLLAEYDSTLDRAREVFVFLAKEGKETRLIKRSLKSFTVEGEDQKDITLKLAFLAARAGYNAVVDIEVKSEKRRDGSFKLVTWSGSGTAAHVDATRHNKKS